jgi:vacuolar protein sorting-associated protein 13A/C
MFSAPTSWIRSYLAQILGDIVKKESLESLSASLWHGKLVLHNAELKEGLLDSLGLPLRLRDGRVSRLEVTIPWTAITSSSIIIRLEGLSLVADARYNFAEEIARLIGARTVAEVEASKKMEAASKSSIDPVDIDRPPDPGMLERFTGTIIDNLQVVIEGVQIRVHDAVTCPQHPFTYGVSASSVLYKVCVWESIHGLP